MSAAGHVSLHAFTPEQAREFLTTPRVTRRQRKQHGRELREALPLASHAQVARNASSRDALALLRAQESGRLPELLPIRYQRMSTDAFAFLRGAAAVMAHDLAGVPSSGIEAQLCGDAHLANFGMFASAERSLVFDINDFDETHPGPFEWDVKRLAASFAVASAQAGHRPDSARRAARAATRTYTRTMATLAGMPSMDVWNARLDVADLISRLGTSALGKAAAKAGAKAGRSTSATALAKLTEEVNGRRRFLRQPPLLMPLPHDEQALIMERIARIYSGYLESLSVDRIALLSRLSMVDIAHKVVGVGSVGLRAVVILFESADGEPLILQAKQAMASSLEPYAGASQFRNHGKRVVVGQRLMQAAGDPFLGWAPGQQAGQGDFYIRQLKDMKGSIDTTGLGADGLSDYARLCGAVLARAHARAADSSMIHGYLGNGPAFAEAVADFAMAYADIIAADFDRMLQWQAAAGSGSQAPDATRPA